MASNRHLGRVVALQALYEYDFRKRANDIPDINDLLERHLGRYKNTIEDQEFVENLIRGVINKLELLDSKIQPLALEWPLEQISRIDHAILRLAMYELFEMQKAIFLQKLPLMKQWNLPKALVLKILVSLLTAYLVLLGAKRTQKLLILGLRALKKLKKTKMKLRKQQHETSAAV